jgi:hypothetical protein
MATPSSEEPPLEVVLLLPFCDPFWDAGACAEASWVAAARISSAIAPLIASLDARLWNGIISFMLNRRLNPPVISGFVPVYKQMQIGG